MLKRLLLYCIAILAVLPAAGQDQAPEWQPVAPEGAPTKFDWIRLTSDEWLKGEILSMYDEKFEFDSDELGVLKLDWDDIAELRSSRTVQVGRETGEPLIGRLLVDGEQAKIVGDEETPFARSEILTIIVGEPKEINLWSVKLTLGGNFRSGNTDQVEYSARGSAVRRSVKDRVSFEYIGNLSSIDSVENANNERFNAKWDRFLSRRLFLNLVGAEWFRDPFQNLSSRTSLTTGVGYEILNTARTDWNVSIGPAYQMTTFESVSAGEDRSVDTLAATLATSLDFDVTDDIELDATYKATFTNKESGKYVHHLVVGLDFELTSRLDFNVSWVWDRTAEPTADADGELPEPDDFRLSVGLGWEF